MRLVVVCLLLFPAIVEASEALTALKADRDKAVYCYYASTMQMQLQGAMATDRNSTLKLLESSQRWQSVVSAGATDMAAQSRAMQHATTELNRRLQATGQDPRKMLDDVIVPTMVACDALLARLEPAEPKTQAATQAAPTTASVPDGPLNGAFAHDVFDGLFQLPLRDNFRWNMHSTVYADVKTVGVLVRQRTPTATFRLNFDSKISTLCVGELHESHRSEDGYLMHLTAKSDSGKNCTPKVTRGLLFPMAFDNKPSSRRLVLRLYDDLGRLVTTGRFSGAAVEAKRLDPRKLVAIADRVRRMDAEQNAVRRAGKLAKLKSNADFQRLEPFYNSCMVAAPTVRGVGEPRDYCVCMTYKFGVGGRIPEPEFAGYSQDFSRLVTRFNRFTSDNTLYTRLAETCQRCSNSSGALHPGCDEMDNHLLMPVNFAEMLQRLDQPTVRLESSLFFKENFFVIFLQGYSDACSSEIENPVPFDYVVTEYTTDPYAGTFANEVQRSRTYIDRHHAPRYKEIYDKHSKLSPEEFGSALRQMAITSNAEMRRSQSDLQARIHRETEKRVSVRKHLAAGCRADSVQRVYANLNRLFE